MREPCGVVCAAPRAAAYAPSTTVGACPRSGGGCEPRRPLGSRGSRLRHARRRGTPAGVAGTDLLDKHRRRLGLIGQPPQPQTPCLVMNAAVRPGLRRRAVGQEHPRLVGVGLRLGASPRSPTPPPGVRADPPDQLLQSILDPPDQHPAAVLRAEHKPVLRREHRPVRRPIPHDLRMPPSPDASDHGCAAGSP